MDVVLPYVIALSAQKPKTLTLVPSDPGSRYKTRQLQIQVVGKSKMIKTVLVNILDVAKDMQVPPSYIGTFMGYVIGAQAKWDPKKPERQQAFLSGEHESKDLSKIMQVFITEVLLCPQCGLPEILLAPEQKTVYGTCRACGSHSELKITDEKFRRYVINHPPTQSKGAFGGNKAGTKKDTSKAKSRDKKEGKDEDDEENEEGSGSGEEENGENEKEQEKEKEKEKQKEKEKEKEKPAKKEKKSKGKAKDEDNDNVVWFSDTSAEAAKKRRDEMLPESLLTVSEKRARELEELKKMVKETPTATLLPNLQQFKSSKAIDDKMFAAMLFDSLFGPNDNVKTEAKNKKEILQKFANNTNAQIGLLQAVEHFCGEVNLAQIGQVSFIIKEFYDLEILDEENILQWYDDKQGAVAAVREKALPFIKWLKEADEESEEEDD